MTDPVRSSEFRRFVRSVEITLAIVFIFQLMLGIWAVLIEQETARATHENHVRIAEIRASRVASIELTCREATEHNQGAVRGLEALARQKSPPKTAKAKAQERRLVIELAQVIAPRYDCAQRVRELTAPAPQRATR